MKAAIIFTHPIVVIVLFSLTLVSGEHFGGIYLLYLLLALPHGATYAILALAGASLLLFGYYGFKGTSSARRALLLNVAGIACLFGSLLLFFRGSWHYNAVTFSQPIPIATYFLFGFSALGCLLFQIKRFWNRSRIS